MAAEQRQPQFQPQSQLEQEQLNTINAYLQQVIAVRSMSAPGDSRGATKSEDTCKTCKTSSSSLAPTATTPADGLWNAALVETERRDWY